MPVRPDYYPETVVFVLDTCEDPGIDSSKHAARLDHLKQCIGHCAQAKSRVNPAHKFGLIAIRDSVQWESPGVTSSSEAFLGALRNVQPAATGAASVAAAAGASPPPPRPPAAVPAPPLDLGALVPLVHPLAVAEEADGCRVRVVLLYCRSSVVPVWSSRNRVGEALCMDVLFIHDKTAAAAAAATWPGCASPQDVYTWLEDNVDELSGRCGHNAYILEAGAHLAKKVTNHLISLVAHPAQRPPQRALRAAPLDLAVVPPQSTSAAPAATPAPALQGASAPASGSPAAAPGLDVTAYPPLPGAGAPPPAGNAFAIAATAAAAWGSPSVSPPPPPPPQAQHHVSISGQVPLPPPPQPTPMTASNLIDLTNSPEYLPRPAAAVAPPGAAVATTATATAFPPSFPTGHQLPPPGYWPPGLGGAAPPGTNPEEEAAAAAAATTRALAAMAVSQPPPPPPPPPHPVAAVAGGLAPAMGFPGGAFAVGTAPAGDPWAAAAAAPSWPTGSLPPPPPAAGHGPY